MAFQLVRRRVIKNVKKFKKISNIYLDDNYIGIYNPESESSYRRIWHEAPRLSNAISLCIKPDEQILWKQTTFKDERLSTYIKPVNEKGYVWDIEEGSLFDVQKDPKLTNNIISEFPEKAKELLELCWNDAKEPIDFDFMRKFKDRLGCTPVTRELTK